MKNKIAALVCLSSAITAGLQAEDEKNQTVLREYKKVIPTIAGDIRRDMVFVPAAMPMPSTYGSFKIQISQEEVWREPKSTDEYYLGDRTLYNLTWRPKFGAKAGITTEFNLGFSDSDYLDTDINLNDFEMMAFWTLAHRRYAALSLGFGTTLNIGSNEDMDGGHVASIENPGLVAELRGVIGADLFVWASNLKLTYVHEAENDLKRPILMEDGDSVTGDFLHDYMEAHLGTGVSYRFTTWLRMGAELTATWQNWNGDEYEGMDDLKGSALIFAEFSPGAGMHINVAGGLDPFDQDRDDSDSDNTYYVLSLTKIY